MEVLVDKEYNNLVFVVETFHKENCGLERKEYAILGQKELTKGQFGLAMNMYLGKEVRFKEFMKKHWKSFGVKEDEPSEEESFTQTPVEEI